MPILSLLDLPGLSARESAEPGFALALSGVAARLGLDPNYLGAVMSLESGFDPQATNPNKDRNGESATGLIQFMPATAKLVGTTVEALHAMTAIQQLPFVEAFYKVAGRGIRKDTPGDYYMATFMPKFVGAPPETVLATRGEANYDENAGLDTDGDGTITVADVWKKIDTRVGNARTVPMLVIDTDAEKKSPLPAARAPSLQSPSPGSPLPSSGQPSASAEGRAPSMTRELIVFAASCELEDMALIVQQPNAAELVEQRVRVYWADVLHQALNAPHPKEWCGALALWCLHQGGVGLELRWLFGPPHFGFLWNLETTKTPEPGDIAYLDKPYQHHAIVVTVEGDIVHTIDGNQGAAEPIKTHEAPLTHWTAFYSIAKLLELEPPTGAA